MAKFDSQSMFLNPKSQAENNKTRTLQQHDFILG